MIHSTQGDILRDESEAIVNTVNSVGVMGRGIALQFRNAYPENYKAYKKACQREEVKPGSMFVFETGELTGPRYIIHFPTKRHWRGKSRTEDIDSGLKALVEVLKEKKIRSIALPPLGTRVARFT
jgi:O-acetyl-ADP-ribose deacetylase (regulator of RNase III)